MPTRAERLRELREAGASFSRNRSFDFWQAAENKPVLALHRYLEALAGELRELAAQRDLVLSLGGTSGEARLELRLRSARAQALHTARLTHEELALLAEEQGVSEIFARYGLSALQSPEARAAPDG